MIVCRPTRGRLPLAERLERAREALIRVGLKIESITVDPAPPPVAATMGIPE